VPASLAALRTWPLLRWGVAAASAVAAVLVVGVPTVIVPNPVFGRDVPVTSWAWPVLLVSAVLAGLLTATYVRRPVAAQERPSRAGLVGGLMTYFAVGCPVCNKLALLALGYSGALQWFAPVQPFLGVLAVAVLGWALNRRLAGEVACPLPASAPARVP
jgi:hypothetical protein